MNEDGAIGYVSNSSGQIIQSAMGNASQPNVSGRIKNCEQAETDALSVHAINIRRDIYGENGRNDGSDESEEDNMPHFPATVKTKLKIQHEVDHAEAIQDIGDIRRAERKKNQTKTCQRASRRGNTRVGGIDPHQKCANQDRGCKY